MLTISCNQNENNLTGKHYLSAEFYQMHLLYLFKWPHVFSLFTYYCSTLLPWICPFHTILAYLKEAQLVGTVLKTHNWGWSAYAFRISTSAFTSETNLWSPFCITPLFGSTMVMLTAQNELESRPFSPTARRNLHTLCWLLPASLVEHACKTIQLCTLVYFFNHCFNVLNNFSTSQAFKLFISSWVSSFKIIFF